MWCSKWSTWASPDNTIYFWDLYLSKLDSASVWTSRHFRYALFGSPLAINYKQLKFMNRLKLIIRKKNHNNYITIELCYIYQMYYILLFNICKIIFHDWSEIYYFWFDVLFQHFLLLSSSITLSRISFTSRDVDNTHPYSFWIKSLLKIPPFENTPT